MCWVPGNWIYYLGRAERTDHSTVVSGFLAPYETRTHSEVSNTAFLGSPSALWFRLSHLSLHTA